MQHLDPENFVCTNLVDVKAYGERLRDEVSKFLPATENNCNKDEKDLFGLKIVDKTFVTLENECSATHFGQCQQTENKSTLLKHTRIENPSNEECRLESHLCKQRWENHVFNRSVVPIPHERDAVNGMEEDLVPYSSALVLVRYYRPHLSHMQSRATGDVRFMQEIAILSNQTLADLRDKFQCVLDYGSVVEMVVPKETTFEDMKKVYPSGFIFIENCFYNDMRHPNSMDYSKDIIDWANQRNVGKFTSASMETTKIEDLKLRIGYPYVYQHQGDCQHIVVFTDIRLLRPDEPLATHYYPYVISTNQFNTQLCMMCQREYPKYLIADGDRHLCPVNLFCKECVLLYNYHESGEKMGDFKLFPYFNMNVIINNSVAGNECNSVD